MRVRGNHRPGEKGRGENQRPGGNQEPKPGEGGFPRSGVQMRGPD